MTDRLTDEQVAIVVRYREDVGEAASWMTDQAAILAREVQERRAEDARRDAVRAEPSQGDLLTDLGALAGCLAVSVDKGWHESWWPVPIRAREELEERHAIETKLRALRAPESDGCPGWTEGYAAALIDVIRLLDGEA